MHRMNIKAYSYRVHLRIYREFISHPHTESECAYVGMHATVVYIQSYSPDEDDIYEWMYGCIECIIYMYCVCMDV